MFLIGPNLQKLLTREFERDPDLPRRLHRQKVYFDLAFAISKQRRESGLTQKELAEKLNTTQPNIARWETPGYERYSISRLIDLAEALGMDLEIRFVTKGKRPS